MAINVKLPEALVESAKRYGNIEYRSVPESRLIVAVIARAIHECRACVTHSARVRQN